MAKLVLIRHGESEWNEKGLWTGWQDVQLTKKGKIEARQAALSLRDIKFQMSYTSDLIRAFHTLEIIKEELQIKDLPTVRHHALKERHYGEFTGKNKWEIQSFLGKEKFHKIRRGWDYPIKGGETLKDVFKRAVPYFQESVLPHLKSGKNVLLVAHGNTIRALMKHIEVISDKRIAEVEILTGEIVIYDIDNSGKLFQKTRKTIKKL